MQSPDDDNQQSDQPVNPATPSQPLEGERRKEQDRRSAERQGKYDRRRNRCLHCAHFSEDAVTGKGVCLFHNIDMVSYAFACPNFEPVNPAPEPRKPG